MHPSPNSVSFYVVAHADDWQLFMFPEVFEDMTSPETKTVILVITAGDAGKEEVYWKSREEGCKSSVELCRPVSPETNLWLKKKSFSGREIAAWNLPGFSCYFLRLPDGNLDGNGFESNWHESLQKLLENKIETIQTKDGQTFNKAELIRLLEEIILYESGNSVEGRMNYPNPDLVKNFDDHSDHIAAGLLMDSCKIPETLKRRLFTGYSCHLSAPLLPAEKIFWKSALFAAYQTTVFNISGYDTLREGVSIYREWCVRSSISVSK